ncbi:hypothetical protein [Microcoleus sp. F4-D5]|uniref:hypothetical protein n=1 Tax=Microcoleus sp. F4-D5 TaxID=2818760 RepID=UPI002FD7794E
MPCTRQTLEKASSGLLPFLCAILTKLYSHPRSAPPAVPNSPYPCRNSTLWGRNRTPENPGESRGEYPNELFWWKIT